MFGDMMGIGWGKLKETPGESKSYQGKNEYCNSG